MICPRCDARLLARERTGRTCGRCRRPFALDPKLDRGLHDVRLRRTVERLGDGGRLLLTTEQLRWSLQGRGRPPARPRNVPPGRPKEPEFEGTGVLVFCLGMGAGLLAVAYLLAAYLPSAVILAVPAGGFGIVLLAAMARDTVRLLRRKRILAAWQLADQQWQARRDRQWQQQDAWTAPLAELPGWSVESFEQTVLDRWIQVYGALPEGVVRASVVRPSLPDGPPVLAVLCPDRAVAAFLHANTFGARQGAVLVGTPAEVPAGLPVIVLHDASPEGHLLVAETRAARPGVPVVDAGLSVRTVLAAGDRAVQFYAHQQREELEARLDRLPGLRPAERAWFGAGLWSPLAAVPPRRLLRTAERAAEQALLGEVGFLSWPEPEVSR
ncbi:hypothetical protein ACFP3U_01295 [Kitasatospora misakiensis]|uniref:Uncharacterized protein n=1 Tax=Kitasatospora misakiensis TaxID=67330 RepID=A0ABW0WTM3_9ACTN